MASFWNPESVKKVQEIRKQSELDSEVSDKEFIEMMSQQDYKNNPLIDAIKKIKESSSSSEQTSSALHSINLNKLIREGI